MKQERTGSAPSDCSDTPPRRTQDPASSASACPLGNASGAVTCPLSHISAGAVVCIKQLAAAPDVSTRLREMGICEQRKITLLARDGNLICMVCNARIALSGKLAESILVEKIPAEDPTLK